jgi:hypothetical protein
VEIGAEGHRQVVQVERRIETRVFESGRTIFTKIDGRDARKWWTARVGARDRVDQG